MITGFPFFLGGLYLISIEKVPIISNDGDKIQPNGRLSRNMTREMLNLPIPRRPLRWPTRRIRRGLLVLAEASRLLCIGESWCSRRRGPTPRHSSTSFLWERKMLGTG